MFRLATRQHPERGGQRDPLLIARRPRPADFDRWLFVQPDPTDVRWCEALDAELGELARWYRDDAGEQIGRLVGRWGYSIVCWEAWPVLDRFGAAMGGIAANGADAAEANHFRFRFYPAKLDLYARPSDRAGDFHDFWARQMETSQDGVIHFRTLPGRPVFELRPIAGVLWGLEGDALDAKAPRSLAELIALADELLEFYRATLGPEETLATMLNQVNGTAGMIKQVYRSIGLHRQDPLADHKHATAAVAKATAAVTKATAAGDPAALATAGRQHAAAVAHLDDLTEHLPSRTFHGWPLEQAMVGALMYAAPDSVGRVLRNYAMLDYRSMYCLAAADSRLWELQKAKYIESHELGPAAIDEMRTWITTLDPDALSPATYRGRGVWRRLNVFCKVALQPEDRLVLALIDNNNQVASCWSRIGEVPEGKDTIKVVCLADVILSYFFTGRVMDIRGALTVWPSRTRQKLKRITLFGDCTYDFNKTDPYAILPAHKEAASDPAKRKALKQICVAAYGVTGEAHSPRHVNYGRPQDQRAPTGPDTPGAFYCGPVAALTTAAARLRIGCQAIRAGGFGMQSVAAVHTDSLIVPARLLPRLLAWEPVGNLHPVKGNVNGQPLTGHSFMVWGIGRHTAWTHASGSDDLQLANGSRAGMNDPELDADSPAAWQKMLKAAIILAVQAEGKPQSEAGLDHLIPNDPDPYWSLPLAIPFRAKPDKLWRLWPYIPALEAMDGLALTVAGRPGAPAYLALRRRWPELRAGTDEPMLAARADTTLDGEPAGVLLALEKFDPSSCANYGDLARMLAQPDPMRPERVNLATSWIEALARRDFEFGVAKPEDLSALMAAMRVEPLQEPERRRRSA